MSELEKVTAVDTTYDASEIQVLDDYADEYKALKVREAQLDAFLAELFSARLPSDWRERWHTFVAEQATLAAAKNLDRGRPRPDVAA